MALFQTRLIWPFTLMLPVIVLGGCQQQSPEVAAVEGPEKAPASGLVSPENERSILRKQLFAAATEGVSFETDEGLVAVDAFALSNPAAATDALELGRNEMQSNRVTTAIGHFVTAIRHDPQSALGFNELGQALRQQGKLDQAIVAFRTATDRDSESAAFQYDLARALGTADRRDEAMDAIKKVLQLDPDHGKAHERLSIWHYYAGDRDQAWIHFNAATAAGHAMPPQFRALLEASADQ